MVAQAHVGEFIFSDGVAQALQFQQDACDFFLACLQFGLPLTDAADVALAAVCPCLPDFRVFVGQLAQVTTKDQEGSVPLGIGFGDLQAGGLANHQLTQDCGFGFFPGQIDLNEDVHLVFVPAVKGLRCKACTTSDAVGIGGSKSVLDEFGKENGVNVPKSKMISTIADLRDLDEEFTYPLVIKGKFYEAMIAANLEQAISYFYKISAKWGLPIIVQEYISGIEVNVTALGDGTGRCIGAVPMRKLTITDKGKAWAGIVLDDDELIDLNSNKITPLKKHDLYQFLDDDILFMRNKDQCRFLNFKTGQYKDVNGHFIATVSTPYQKVVLYDRDSKILMSISKNAQILWKEENISKYQLNDQSGQLIYISDLQLGIIDLKDQKLRSVRLDKNVQWISISGNDIHCADIQKSVITLYRVDRSFNKLTQQLITSPEGFEFVQTLGGYFEIRENEHFLLPMYLKRKVTDKVDSDLKITYSNKNSMNKSLNRYLGIYNVKEKQWEYVPDVGIQLPVYQFLNDKGDFIVYEQGTDIVEADPNAVLDLKLVLDYGKKSHRLPAKRSDQGNYFWDRERNQFIYFDKKKWMSYNLTRGNVKELMPSHTTGWESGGHNGLGNSPETKPIRVKNQPIILLSNQFDYFTLDLRTHEVKRITKGEEDSIKYKLINVKEQNPPSSWSVKYIEIDLQKDLIFKMFNEVNYRSGFARYSAKNDETIIYKQKNYKEMIPYEKGLLFTSDFAIEPFKLTRFENGKYKVIYEALRVESKDLKKMILNFTQFAQVERKRV